MDLPVGEHFVIPQSELEWTFTTSGGPGGQHANRTASQAELRWQLSTSVAVDDDVRRRLTAGLSGRVKGGAVVVVAGESRSQWRNRQHARRRLVELLVDALRERPPRIATKPSRRVHRARLDDKRRHGEKKQLRKPPEPD